MKLVEGLNMKLTATEDSSIPLSNAEIFDLYVKVPKTESALQS